MSFIHEVKNILPDKEEMVKKEQEKLFSQEQAMKDSFVRKIKQIIILDAKKGKEQDGIISGRMIFTQEILNDDSNDGYDWYGEHCPPTLETFIKKRPYGFLKYNSIKYYRLVPSAQIIHAYEHLKKWAITENVFLSELYIYDKNNNKELRTKELELANSHVLGDGVIHNIYDEQKLYKQGHASPVSKAEYYYAVNYRITVNR